MTTLSIDERRQIVATVKDFCQREIAPIAMEYEHADRYPFHLVEQMKKLGLFGAIIPPEYGGIGMDFTTYAMIIEEICKVWMSVSGLLNTHVIMSYVLLHHGTEEQKRRWLPSLASGERRAALALTEPNAGSDVQAIETSAVRRGDHYVVNGSKMFITNGRHGTTLLLIAKTDKQARPAHKGISAFFVDKGHPGLTVGRDIDKLGYKGLDTVELAFADVPVPAENLVGGVEGAGFSQVLGGLELGRVNIAARGVGVAQAAFDEAIRYAQQRRTFGKPIAEHQAIQLKLADMATKIQAARLLTYDAAARKDRGERCDLEAGMAKLYASEICHEVALEAMRVLGGYGYTKEFAVERHYRDAPLMIIGEGTNEIQRLLIARQLLRRHRLEA